ncbi:DEAD/DEAH box helicase [Georgenia faecalis]|uniref:SNF2-related protein n=1 Tax=Georgenia faecalis TaxID=2483799 RepID=A0ABV9D9T3_9MICO|nr:DEAD/DEAH box helicase [Georgenia faecalis]
MDPTPPDEWAHLPGDGEIRSALGAQTYERGAAYVRAGRVTNVHGNAGRGAILGTVAGSRPLPYQAIVLVGGASAGRSVFGRCTCPVQINCKHVAAVLIAAREEAGLFAGPPVPAWERALADAVRRDRAAEGDAVLGLLVEVVPGGTLGTGGSGLRLRVRPVLPGKKARWVKQGVSWRTLEADYARRYPDRQRSALNALAHTHRARSSGYYYGDAVLLDEFGPELWPLLHDVVDAGVPLVADKGLPGPVRLAPGPVHLSLGLTRTDPDGPATLAPVLGEHPGRVSLLGTPAHGVVVEPPDGLHPLSAAGEAGLLLAPLAERVGEDVARLIGRGPLSIPADDVERFVREYYPRLRRVIAVGSPDGSVDLPQVAPPRLVVRLTYTADHGLTVAWAFRYDDDAARDVGIGTEPTAQDLRDARAEARLLAGLTLPAPWDARLRSPVGRLEPRTELRGFDAAVFTEEVVPALRELPGLVVDVVGSPPEYRYSDSVPVIKVSAIDTDDADWFDLGVQVELDGERIPFRALFVALARGERHLVLQSGTYFTIDRPELDQLRRLIEEARELTDADAEGLRMSTFHVGLWEQFSELGIVEEQSWRWQDRVERLLGADGAEEVAVPSTLHADLRPYQVDGYRWLSHLMDAGLGGILADDMGLGKTLQTLAAICRTHEAGRLDAPVLVVAPTSVVGGWASEAARFAPGLHVATVAETQGKSGVPLAEHVAAADVVITSYALFRIDFDAYAALTWSGLVLDEAQFVKNHQAKTYQCARTLAAPFKLAITGTPLENSLMDLWSLLSIVAPGMFPDPHRFAQTYRIPIERGGDAELLRTLRRRIGPFIRRRTKEQVATELPPKQEQVLTVTLNPRHRRIYETHLQRERRKILGLIDDMDKNRFTIFRSLTLLRQLSLDPTLIDDKYAGVSSSKADAFMENLEEVISGGHRALVFSQFTTFLKTVRDRLDAMGVDYCYLDGTTRHRARRIEEFKTGSAPVFLISLKAGGFGLNLTEADYCFVLDPWWNPAVETQAVDRAHRIGQDKTVMVYRLVAAGTIEEKVMELKARKQDLFDRVMDDGDALMSSPLSADDIRGLLAG